MGLSLLAQGCWVGKTVCRGLGNARPDSCKEKGDDGGDDDDGTVQGGAQPDSGGASPFTPITSDVQTVTQPPSFALTRIVPEQMSNNFANDTGFTDHRYYDPEVGRTLDWLVQIYGVPLGGIDFAAATRRDPSTKAQTVLVARVGAWQIATAAFWQEWSRTPATRKIFTQADIQEWKQRPVRPSDAQLPQSVQDEIKDGETRWSAQVDELFWRFYSRPPTEGERAAVRTAFLKAYGAGQDPANPWSGNIYLAWASVLYAVMAAEEYWHI